MYEMTQQKVSPATAIAEFKQTKIMLLDHVYLLTTDQPTTNISTTTTGIQYDNAILVTVIVTIAIALIKNDII